MEKTIQPTEARTLTDLVVEETTFSPAIEAVVKKSFPSSAQEARLSLGEDSCTTFSFEGTYTVGTETQVLSTSGIIEVGSSYERAQTTAFKLTDAFHDALAVMGCHSPKMLEAVMASMQASKDGLDSAQALADAGFAISPEARSRATAHMKTLATSSVRTVSASVKVHLDA
tara:strand:- start:257 stop:769 length:513 start_codon:yes stop_codon:yes gene_type:complete